MIRSRRDLRYYLEEDRIANGLAKCSKSDLKKRLLLFFRLRFDKRLRFHTLLRYYEYYSNQRSLWYFVPKFYYYYLFKKISYQLGFSIYKNCFGPGLCVKHYGYVVVNPLVKVGKNCSIHSGVNIGETDGKAPVIGDNVYIGPGAKIFGPITIADDCKIGANAVVNKSFMRKGAIIVGVPAIEKYSHKEM